MADNAILLKVQADVAEMKSDLAVVKSHLLGNGVDGLVQTVAQHTKELNQLQGVAKFTQWVIPIIVALGGSLGALAAYLLRS